MNYWVNLLHKLDKKIFDTNFFQFSYEIIYFYWKKFEFYEFQFIFSKSFGIRLKIGRKPNISRKRFFRPNLKPNIRSDSTILHVSLGFELLWLSAKYIFSVNIKFHLINLKFTELFPKNSALKPLYNANMLRVAKKVKQPVKQPDHVKLIKCLLFARAYFLEVWHMI